MRFGRPYISEQQAEQISQFGELASGGNDAFELAVAQFIGGVLPAHAGRRPRRWSASGSATSSPRAPGTRERRSPRWRRRYAAWRPVRGRKVVVLLTEGFYLGRGDGVRDGLRRATDRGRRDARERGHLLDRRRRALGALTGRRHHGKKPGRLHQALPGGGRDGREPPRGHARRGRADGRARRDQPQRHRQGAAAGPRRQRALLPARVPADVVRPARPLPPHRGPPARPPGARRQDAARLLRGRARRRRGSRRRPRTRRPPFASGPATP